MKTNKGYYLSLTLLAALSSVVVACGRKGGDDPRLATRGNVAIEGLGVASGSTLENKPYYIKVQRIYSVRNGYTTGVQSGYMGCVPANNVYGTAVNSQGIYADIQVNGVCKTFALPNSPSYVEDAELGLIVSMTCDNSYSCDMVYLNIVGRNPLAYANGMNQTTLTPMPGGTLGYGYSGNSTWAMTAETQVKQIGVMKSISQDRIMTAIEIQTVFSQKLSPAQLMLELQRTSLDYYGH